MQTDLAGKWIGARAELTAWISTALLSVLFALLPGRVLAETLGAEFSKQVVPLAMVAGETYNVSVTMTNTGAELWFPSSTYKLGSQNPPDNWTWNVNRISLKSLVMPGQKGTFTFTVRAPAIHGTYAFQWKMINATRWFGSASPSTPIVVGATGPENQAPVVLITAPSTGATAIAPGTFAISASASDADGAIASVKFFANGALIDTDASAPYTYSFTGVAAGTYALTARATDNLGLAATSAPVSVVVTAPPRPSATRTYIYDDNERLCKTIEPESGATIVEYDAAGNVAWSVQGSLLTASVCDRASVPVASRTVRRYDARNRLVHVATPGGVADVATSYFADGQVQSLAANNPGGYEVVTSYEYNKRRLLTGESSLNGSTLFTLVYGYDANGSLSALTYPDGHTVGISHDSLGRTSAMASTTAGGPAYASGVTYHPNGAISGFAYGNGVIHTMSQNSRQLPERSRDVSNLAVVMDDTYTYDANGNVMDIVDRAQAGLTTRGMAYDGLDRLTLAVSPGQWGTAAYSYDGLDNLLSADQGTRRYRYQYDTSTNRLSSIKDPAGVTVFGFGYDTSGNVVSKGTQAFQFDSANRLNQVIGTETYRYDGQGRRVQTTDSDGRTTFWIYNQAGQVLYTSEGRRSRNISYIYLGNTQVATRSFLWATGAITMRAQHTDALGTPVATSLADQTVPRRLTHAPYGGTYGPAVDGTGYTGHVMDAVTGLIYMQQRYYDPLVARFVSTDPIPADPNSGAIFNNYWYANNNPYRFIDPDGRSSESRVCGVSGCDGGSFATGDPGLKFDTSEPSYLPVAAGLPQAARPKEEKSIGEKLGRALRKTFDVVFNQLLPAFGPAEAALGVGLKSAGGGIMLVRLGLAGETAVRAVHAIGPRGLFIVNGRLRISDGLNVATRTLSEVKNVKYQGLTTQLRDYSQYAMQNGLRFDLYMRPGATLSGPLQASIRAGEINLRVIP